MRRNSCKRCFLITAGIRLERVGRYKMNKKLGIDVTNDKDHWVLTREDIIGAIKYLIESHER